MYINIYNDPKKEIFHKIEHKNSHFYVQKKYFFINV